MKQKQRLAEGIRKVGLPEEVLLDVPRVVLMGDQRVIIENHKGIVEYAGQSVRVRTACGLMEIQGNDLRLEYFGASDLVVLGRIDMLGYHLHRG